MFLECVPVGDLEANCFVLCDEKTKIGAIIDPGEYTEEVKNAIKNSGMEILEYILCTHGHFDHITGVAKIKKDYPNAKICIGKEDTPYLDNALLSLAVIFKADFEPCKPDMEFSHGDNFSIGNINVKIHSAPGHTPGGVLYVLEDEKIIFTGDTLFCGSVGRTNFKGGSTAELMKTLSEIKEFPDDYVIYTGHGESSTIGYEKRTNMFLR